LFVVHALCVKFTNIAAWQSKMHDGFFISPQFAVLNEFPSNWKTRAKQKCYGQLTVIVPCVADLLISQLKRGEPRDSLHAQLVRQLP
jgi:hypothetical protein